MERLWTPWRREYVAGGEPQGCFLCEKARQDADEENLILYRGALGFALLNAYPYNTAHVMVAPYLHTGDLAGLDPEIGATLWALTQHVARMVQGEYSPDGFNIGLNLGRAGGAGLVDHLHIHVVPRWAGDTNYMPVIGQTKVLPETLEQTYRRLRPRFAP